MFSYMSIFNLSSINKHLITDSLKQKNYNRFCRIAES